MSEKDYLSAESKSDTKHEFFDGLVVAMAGANERNEIAALDLASLINLHLCGKKSAASSNPT